MCQTGSKGHQPHISPIAITAPPLLPRLLGLSRSLGHGFQEEGHSAFPIAIGTDGGQAAVVLGLVLFQVAAQVHQGFR